MIQKNNTIFTWDPKILSNELPVQGPAIEITSEMVSTAISKMKIENLVQVQFFRSHCVSIPSSRSIIPLLPPLFSIQSIRFTSVIYLPSMGISFHGRRHLQNSILIIISSGFRLWTLFRQIGKLL